jgi:hypothetical protein
MTRLQAVLQVLRSGGWVQVVALALTAAVSLHVINAPQDDAILRVVGGVATLAQLVSTVVTTFQHAKSVHTTAVLEQEVVPPVPLIPPAPVA